MPSKPMYCIVIHVKFDIAPSVSTLTVLRYINIHNVVILVLILFTIFTTERSWFSFLPIRYAIFSSYTISLC